MLHNRNQGLPVNLASVHLQIRLKFIPVNLGMSKPSRLQPLIQQSKPAYTSQRNQIALVFSFLKRKTEPAEAPVTE